MTPIFGLQERLKSFHLDGKRVLLCTDEVLSSYANLIPEALVPDVEWGTVEKMGVCPKEARQVHNMRAGNVCCLQCVSCFLVSVFHILGVVRFLISMYVGKIEPK